MRFAPQVLLAACLCSQAYGACFDPKSLNTYPRPAQAEIYFDIDRLLAADKKVAESLNAATGEPPGSWARQNPSSPPTQEQFKPEPGGYVWQNHIDPTKYDAKKFVLKPSGTDFENNYVFFYEPDRKGGKRVCRVEEWTWRGNPRNYGYLPEYTEESLNLWPSLKLMTSEFAPRSVYSYLYDESGRVAEWRHHQSSVGYGEPGRFAFYPAPDRRKCYLRDASGRLTRLVEDIQDSSRTCTTVDKETGGIIDYRYDKDGRFAGSIQALPGNPDHRDTHPAWSLIYRLRPSDARYLEAEANSWWGLHYLSGIPQIEDVPDRQVPDDKLGAPYRFPEGAPISVMDNLPQSIKAHRRIREGPATGMGTVSEMFPPNGGLTERIFWRQTDGIVFRHERFKNGKPYQIINDALVLDKDGKSYLYDEDLAALDAVLKHPRINVPRSHVRLRVYKVDASGKQTLVALSWSKALPEPGPGGLSREQALKDLWRTIRGKDGPKKPEPSEADLRVRYTDPQGKEIWRDWGVFLKATGFVEKISAFFPHGTPPRNRPSPPLPRKVVFDDK